MEHKLYKAYSQTFPAKDFGNDDEKRLQREFHDKNIKLRWNNRVNKYEIWYKSIRQLYLVYSIEWPYNICRAIKDMKHRERSMNDVFHDYLAGEEKYKKDKRDHIHSMAVEVAKGVENYHKQKISVRV
jgi:hypothetical protein